MERLSDLSLTSYCMFKVEFRKWDPFFPLLMQDVLAGKKNVIYPGDDHVHHNPQLMVPKLAYD